MVHHRLAAALGLALLAAVVQAPAFSDEGHWPVDGKLLGKDDEKSEDISGIACSTSIGFPRDCLVIDDNLQSAQRITLFEGRGKAGAVVPLISNRFASKALELDGEGVAFAEDKAGRKYFYVLGSHGHPRDRKHKLDPTKDSDLIAAKIKASSQIVRLELVGDKELRVTQPVASLRGAIAAVKPLAPHVDRRLELDGVTIEGLAVVGDRLYAGFRAPTFSLTKDTACEPSSAVGRPCALVLSVSLQALFEGGALDPKPAYLHLGDKQGIRDLAPFKDGLLVLSGPAADIDGTYEIFWWNRESAPAKLATLPPPPAGANKKAEAILPLDEGPSGIRILVMYDLAEEGAPLAVTIPFPK
ncbi:DUF3616 domain-containing protein [Methylobacterium sp. NEAU 140]|uniref:DUF3616 domain-containing protein n=1 Tax=Methylobacterium sp. NEAU 140 TaxID=3064945 RepID=UPI002732E04A|nr:DUF3616 domain-containing protein [Methylobacterium sp. NEAU 140]MDP4026824.1 DUF3616 domain-containing protein [Methylobacterium sp. NEAU 140]